MSTTRVAASCRETDATPVEIPANALDSTAREYLRDLRADLDADGLVPTSLRVEACFAEDCSLATQAEAERVRDHVDAASFLGAGRVTVEVSDVADPGKVRPALAAAEERAEREGVTLEVEGLDL